MAPLEASRMTDRFRGDDDDEVAVQAPRLRNGHDSWRALGNGN